MAKRKKEVKDEKAIIPSHFQTWGDLMLNLLTLFILLCSFAQEKHAKFFAGIGSFITNIESYGLPGLLPSDTKPVLLDSHNDKFLAPMIRSEEEMEGEARDAVDRVALEKVWIKGEAWIPGSIQFERGSARLGKEAIAWLGEQMASFREGDFDVEIRGHAWQECRDREADWKLSLHRAYAVMAHLNEAGGIPLPRMHAVGYGAFRPLSEGEKDPPLNRRVNIKLVKSR